MQRLGVIVILDDGVPASPMVQEAVVSYCKWKFGQNENSGDWRNVYHEELAQLKTMTGYTDWGGVNG